MEIIKQRLAEFPANWPKLTALLLGAVAACGYPPLHGWWIAMPALAYFVWHLHKAPDWRAAFGRGWLFGWAHLTLANNWIATAFTHQAKMPEFLGWIAVPLLCVYLAVYPALAALTAHRVARKSGSLAFGVVLAGAWILTEWLRSWVFTGYPWPPLGLMFLGTWDVPGAAFILPWTGSYALSGLVILVASAILSAALSRRWLVLFASVAALTAIMLAPVVIGIGKLNSGDSVRYTLVQPLLVQEDINDPTKFEEQFSRITDLTLPGNDQSRLVLWPESAVPDYLEDGYPQRYYDRMTVGGDPDFARRRIAAVVGQDATLLTGVVNLDFRKKAGIKSVESARNSVLSINGAGEITGHYAKAHLVPYGEYLPMRGMLEPLGLSRLVAGSIDYKEGPGPGTIDLGHHGKAGIQICYEIVFSGQVVDQANRPDYIFNPSNDGWFGAWGPPQHLAQARMRAIEEGLPVLRSTTTGISAVIDAHGIVRENIASGTADAVSGTIPPAHSPTLFSQLGNALALVWAGLLIALGIGLPRMLALVRSRR
ncbi:apolipoprotein N-acyltransferase [Erythrobacter crassostreae]|uniref:Apolipoprotein N-acyltransferase n=1 Tax=Erythrobacter crassostreae TaxID=2828328 RepID=A0A9X1F3W6_9SPHN|nr:apolipoprotein N-acyltransferase [Erythrobacter crassostrea]MBV7258350.1 apolipoprotein N-acyltransferase [Erythrobacter crassostrea]